MNLTLDLGLDDQMAWFDYIAEMEYNRASWLMRTIKGRERYSRGRETYRTNILSIDSHYALGLRTLDIEEDGVVESVGPYVFTSEWQDLDFWSETAAHIFIAHQTLNCHIIPQKCLPSPSVKSDLLAALNKHLKQKRLIGD